MILSFLSVISDLAEAACWLVAAVAIVWVVVMFTVAVVFGAGPEAFAEAVEREAARQEQAKRRQRRDKLGLRVVGGTDYAERRA